MPHAKAYPSAATAQLKDSIRMRKVSRDQLLLRGPEAHVHGRSGVVERSEGVVPVGAAIGIHEVSSSDSCQRGNRLETS